MQRTEKVNNIVMNIGLRIYTQEKSLYLKNSQIQDI